MSNKFFLHTRIWLYIFIKQMFKSYDFFLIFMKSTCKIVDVIFLCRDICILIYCPWDGWNWLLSTFSCFIIWNHFLLMHFSGFFWCIFSSSRYVFRHSSGRESTCSVTLVEGRVRAPSLQWKVEYVFGHSSGT